MDFWKAVELMEKQKKTVVGATIWANEFDFSVTKQKARTNKPFQEAVITNVLNSNKVNFIVDKRLRNERTVFKRNYEHGTMKIYFSLNDAIEGYFNELEKKKAEVDAYATQRKKVIDGYQKKIKDVKKKYGI